MVLRFLSRKSHGAPVEISGRGATYIPNLILEDVLGVRMRTMDQKPLLMLVWANASEFVS